MPNTKRTAKGQFAPKVVESVDEMAKFEKAKADAIDRAMDISEWLRAQTALTFKAVDLLNELEETRKTILLEPEFETFLFGEGGDFDCRIESLGLELNRFTVELIGSQIDEIKRLKSILSVAKTGKTSPWVNR